MNRLSSSFDFDDSDFLYPEREREEDVVHDLFRNFVNQTLSCCNSVKKFSLKCQDDVQHMRLTIRWISTALERGVSDLDLRVKMPFAFINKTLVKLTLGTELSLGVAPVDEVDLPLLKSLFLHTVWFSDQDLCDTIIRGCPELEELYIHNIYIEYREDDYIREDFVRRAQAPYYIAHGNIKKLTIRYNNHHHQAVRILLFDTSNLIYLDYSDYLTCNLTCEYEPTNALLEARLNLVFCPRGRWRNEHQNCSNIMNYVRDVQILYFSSSTVEVMYDCLDYWRNHNGFPFFKNLATLHFESSSKQHWKLLSIIIENSPKLEILVLRGLCGISDCEVNICGNMVKVLEIQGYEERLGELNQVKCFLREMENLEELQVHVSDEIENKLQLTNNLLALPKGSSKCNIHVL